MPESRNRDRPSLTVDIVVVAPLASRTKVVLVRRSKPPFAGLWALPGGFVELNEPLAAAARRELREETGVEPVHLQQLHTFGDPGRDPRGWTVSVAYLACLTQDKAATLRLRAGSDADEAQWFDLEHLPPLAFDHAAILACATRQLAADRPGGADVEPAR